MSGDRELLSKVRSHLEAVIKEKAGSYQYDSWTESRKALAHEILAMLSAATLRQAVRVDETMEVIINDLRHSAMVDGYTEDQERFVLTIAERIEAALSAQPASGDCSLGCEKGKCKAQDHGCPSECVRPKPAQPVGVGVPDVVSEVMAELEKAIRKFPTWPTDPLHAVGVFNEEAGELSKAVLQQVYEPHKNPSGAVRSEARQAAAMALRFLASMDRYEWTPGAQHEQENLK